MTNAPSGDPLETSPIEVREVIGQLVNHKAPGFDLVTNVVLKNFSMAVIVYFTSLLNAIFRLNYYPSSWKIGKVVPV